MNITLKLFASLRRYLPEDCTGSACDLEVDPGTTVADVLARYGVPTEGIVILVNGRSVDLDQALEEGDVMAVFHALAGG
jgi:sulfur carrier protein ThiS